MNRLLQHFVDSSGGAQGVPPTRPPIPAPPQSSGGSYHAGNRGSYQRAAPGGPFFYQAPPTQPHSGLDEIPLTSQSTGGVYETVDLNADSSQQHRPPQYQNHHQNQHQRLFTPPAVGHRPPVGHGPPLYKTPTPPGSRDGNRSQHLYHPHAPGSTGSAAELFSSGPPPVVAGPPSSGGSSGNPYRRQAAPHTTRSRLLEVEAGSATARRRRRTHSPRRRPTVRPVCSAGRRTLSLRHRRRTEVRRLGRRTRLHRRTGT
jgi:hypothetical protein